MAKLSDEEFNKIYSIMEGVDPFHLALGYFVAKFSETEALLQTVLWNLAGLEAPMSQAVLSGIRTDDAMGKINRIASAQKWPQGRENFRQHVFTQLGHINKLRNNILHYGAQLEGPDTWRISNENFVHVPENISSQVISPGTLKAAQDDLDQIDLLLLDLMLVGSEKLDEEAFADAHKYAWKYKPPPQAGDRHKTPKSPQGRGRQRRPSRA